MPRSASIRRKLLTDLLTGLTIISIGVGVATFLVTRYALTREFDRSLLSKAKALATLLQDEGKGRYEFEFSDEMMPEFERRESPEFFEIWLPNGTVIERSRSLQGQPFARQAPKSNHPSFRNVSLPHGHKSGRAVAFPFVPHLDDDDDAKAERDGDSPDKGPFAAVIVAQSRKSLDSTLALLGVIIAGGCLLVPIVGGLLVVYSVRSALSPLEKLAERLGQIGPERPEERLSVHPLPAEIQPVQSTVNGLLDRLHGAIERERKFTSDVSHELRTPLAEIRTAVEVAARWPEDTALHASSCKDALEAVEQMQEIVAKLLLLVRSENLGADALQWRAVDLVACTRDLALRSARASGETIITVHAVPDTPIIVKSDQVLLESILRNLISNAVDHSAGSEAIQVLIEQQGSVIRWTIENAAPGLTEADAADMVLPFWRKDVSRTGTAHAGLGLALVQSFCRLLGIELRFRIQQPDRLQVTLSIAQQ